MCGRKSRPSSSPFEACHHQLGNGFSTPPMLDAGERFCIYQVTPLPANNTLPPLILSPHSMCLQIQFVNLQLNRHRSLRCPKNGRFASGKMVGADRLQLNAHKHTFLYLQERPSYQLRPPHWYHCRTKVVPLQKAFHFDRQWTHSVLDKQSKRLRIVIDAARISVYGRRSS